MIPKIITILFISFIIYSCNSNTETENISTDVVFNPNTELENSNSEKKLPQFQFQHTNFDFGLIYEGEEVLHKFKFKNIGSSPLIISDVSATCGCTITTFTKNAIEPGEEGFIEVTFDSSGRKGMQHKTVNILANTQPNQLELTFTAEIEIPN